MEKKKMSGKKKAVIILAVVLGICVLFVGIAYAVLHHYHSKSNYVKDDQVQTIDEDQLSDEDKNDVSNSMTEEEQKQAEEEAQKAQAEIVIPNGSDVYNILLIGSDRRDTSWYGNSDVMMLVSINKNTEKIYVTSFMRDSYALVEGYGAHKLNFAYAIGGGPKLVETIEKNYRISIDNYAAGDFSSTATIIDMVGGVDITVNDGEAELINKNTIGDHETLPGAGTYHLNGNQAVAYGRIRYVGNADYERTERQRRVVEQIFNKAKNLSISELNDLANEILPLITHNISERDTLSLLTSLPTIMGYDMELGRIPYDGMFSSKGEMLVPDWEATITKLHNTIYAES